MDAWTQCKFCTWRRTLHILLTVYLVTSNRQFEVQAAVAVADPSKSTYHTASPTQQAISDLTCKPSCALTDIKLPCLVGSGDCKGTLSCTNTPNCILHCSDTSLDTSFMMNIRTNALCASANDLMENNLIKCDPTNGWSLQIEKHAWDWSDIFLNLKVDVACFVVFTNCSSKSRCCPDTLKWNCNLLNRFSVKITVFPTPTTTSVTSPRSTSTVTTSVRPTKAPSTSTKPTTTSTKRTTMFPTWTKRTTMLTTSTKRTTMFPTTIKSTSIFTTSGTVSQSPGILTSIDPTQTVTEGRFKASQTDTTNIPTIVAVVSLFVLTIAITSAIVIIVLRRNRSRKGAANPEFIIDNTAYGEARPHPKMDHVPVVPKSSSGTPAKSKPDEDHTYCYASFDDAKETQNNKTEHVVQDPNTKSSDNSYFVLEKEGQQHKYKPETEEANVVKVKKEQQQMTNKQDNPSNYFVLENVESVNGNSRQEKIGSEKYFVLETTSKERKPDLKDDMSDKDDTDLGEVDDNYFHVAKTDAGTRATSTASSIHSTIENQNNTDNNNYFVLDKITDDRKVVNQIKLTDVGNSRTDDIRMINRSTTEADTSLPTKGTPTTAVDPYDHVRVGHAQTNGFDDGVYDELRKQRVRCDCEVVDDDYDHCGKRQ